MYGDYEEEQREKLKGDSKGDIFHYPSIRYIINHLFHLLNLLLYKN